MKTAATRKEAALAARHSRASPGHARVTTAGTGVRRLGGQEFALVLS